jgi:hypothetical protein
MSVSDHLQGAIVELSNYEIIRYPSGQAVITSVALNAQGAPSSGPRDVIGVYASETEAQRALERIVASRRQAA